MSKAFMHGTKNQIEEADAGFLWFNDERDKARALDPAIVWLEVDKEMEREAWAKLREQVLSRWIAAHPGTRPRAFWVYDAPRSLRLPDEPEQRRQVGGAGHPACIESGFGIPHCWQDFDPSDPPVFESEASYLQRHGLLSAEEKRRANFSPVAVRNEDDLIRLYGRFECVE